MKRFFSIVFALLILLSGLHLSVATHFCGSEFVAVRWSVTGEKATCGMEKTEAACPMHDAISSNCCKDEVSVYQTDQNYSPSHFIMTKAELPLLQVFSIPSLSLSGNSVFSCLFSKNTSPPPDKLPGSAVWREKICVFLI